GLARAPHAFSLSEIRFDVASVPRDMPQMIRIVVGCIVSRQAKRRMRVEVGSSTPAGQREGDIMIDLSGKVAAVTGAAGGIGAEVARTLARAGDKVILGDVQAERVEGLDEHIIVDGGEDWLVT